MTKTLPVSVITGTQLVVFDHVLNSLLALYTVDLQMELSFSSVSSGLVHHYCGIHATVAATLAFL